MFMRELQEKCQCKLNVFNHHRLITNRYVFNEWNERSIEIRLIWTVDWINYAHHCWLFHNISLIDTHISLRCQHQLCMIRKGNRIYQYFYFQVHTMLYLQELALLSIERYRRAFDLLRIIDVASIQSLLSHRVAHPMNAWVVSPIRILIRPMHTERRATSSHRLKSVVAFNRIFLFLEDDNSSIRLYDYIVSWKIKPSPIITRLMIINYSLKEIVQSKNT
jgi:hypothetical protein